MDIRTYNRDAWNREVEAGNKWTIPVSSDVISAARQGQWDIVLTPTKPVPHQWFPNLTDLDVLCLASGGGQQGPILAAAGANVIVFDNSPKQLNQDRMVAERENLDIITIEGDMANLSIFTGESFDLIIHPVSNIFVPDVRPVWDEAYRVLRFGGNLLSGFNNPLIFMFDPELMDEKGKLKVKYSIPYSDLTSPSEKTRIYYREMGWPLEFGHTIDDQIGGQLEAGFIICGFYEDIWPESPLSKFIPSFMATRALKTRSIN
jgi:SAM-dependent methyltransferase